MSQEQLSEPCGSDCGVIKTDRNRYFTGKYMTARDFADEQAYFLSRQHLHNRLLHGWGVVCGLGVHPHPQEDCRDRWVVIQAGVALDCCGREIVLEQSIPYELPLPRRDANGRIVADENAISEPFLLCLEYAEEGIEFVPALYSEAACDPTRREANRICEKPTVTVVRYHDPSVHSDCWHHAASRAEAGPLSYKNDCDAGTPGPGGACLKPGCPCGRRVPLALITPRKEGDHADQAASLERKKLPAFSVDTQGRRTLPVPPEYMTHIVHINWPHGGALSKDDLRRMGGRLEITFDRNILAAQGDATGINEQTFQVRYKLGWAAPVSMPTEDELPPALHGEHAHKAVFKIDPTMLEHKHKHQIPGILDSTVYITLKCDFILDCHGNPVDGNHLRGRLPSGDGNPGGDFCSWFRVVEHTHGGADGGEA